MAYMKAVQRKRDDYRRNLMDQLEFHIIQLYTYMNKYTCEQVDLIKRRVHTSARSAIANYMTRKS